MEIKLTLKDMPMAKKYHGNLVLSEVTEVPNNTKITIDDSFKELSNTILTNLYTEKWTMEEYQNWLKGLKAIEKNNKNIQYYYNTINNIIKNENSLLVKNTVNDALNVTKYNVNSKNNYEILNVLKQFLGELHKLSTLYVNKYGTDTEYSKKLLNICNRKDFTNTKFYLLIVGDIKSVFKDKIYNNRFFYEICQIFIENNLKDTVIASLHNNISNTEAKKAARELSSYVDYKRQFGNRYEKRKRK